MILEQNRNPKLSQSFHKVNQKIEVDEYEFKLKIGSI
ncbi:unnamed protein product [Paramecium octaurelia]|uniref:Uncharacterized protein n=1 Tax=Paramecium octaurelia TaxID=43137 RepID=A0A8S1TQW3_PAROT|nr:unnamed protein product [Paramecium octaurelia]